MPPALLLCRARLPDGRRADVRLRRGRIVEVGDLAPRAGERRLDLCGLLLLPGLVNAHDHLDLDLLPRLGRPPYPSALAWLRALEASPPPEAAALARVPFASRLGVGALRNLVAGVTTVVHHGRLPLRKGPDGLAVRVVWPLAVSESVRRDPTLRTRARRARGRMLLSVHAGEGTDAASAGELAALDAAGALHAGILVVHGVALDQAGAALLAARGARLAHCPASNVFLLGRTLAPGALPGTVAVGLGTDSTMSGSVTLLDELRVAARASGLSPARLLALVTDEGARAAGVPARGVLRPGFDADLMAVPERGDPATSLLAARPADVALVVVGGHLRVARPGGSHHPGLEPGRVDGADTLLPAGSGALVRDARARLGPDFDSPVLRLLGA